MKLLPPRTGEVIGDSADRRVEILCDDDALHATWSRFGPGRDGADLHVHREHTDLFYVLEGELTVRLGPGGEGVVVPAGTLARVPPLVVHGFRNGSDADVRYLNAPGQGFADFLRALRDGRDLSYDQEPPPADGGRPATEAVVGGHLSVSECPGRRTVLLADADAIAVAEIHVDPGGPPVCPHAHESHVEWLFALEGEMVLTTGRQELHVEAGSWAEVPQGVSHSLSFAGETRFLELHSPVA
jgi:uncharacterized cupin superfamily protein